MKNDLNLWPRFKRYLRANNARYEATEQLKFIADMAQPWTVEGLKDAVREWLREDT